MSGRMIREVERVNSRRRATTVVVMYMTAASHRQHPSSCLRRAIHQLQTIMTVHHKNHSPKEHTQRSGYTLHVKASPDNTVPCSYSVRHLGGETGAEVWRRRSSWDSDYTSPSYSIRTLLIEEESGDRFVSHTTRANSPSLHNDPVSRYFACGHPLGAAELGLLSPHPSAWNRRNLAASCHTPQKRSLRPGPCKLPAEPDRAAFRKLRQAS